MIEGRAPFRARKEKVKREEVDRRVKVSATQGQVSIHIIDALFVSLAIWKRVRSIELFNEYMFCGIYEEWINIYSKVSLLLTYIHK